MSANKELFTATDWMAYYEKLFQGDTPIKVCPLSLEKSSKTEQSDGKGKDGPKG